MKKVLLILLVFLTTFALAENQINIGPQSIIITPSPPSPSPAHNLKVDIWLNKSPYGNFTPTYYIGERLEVGVRTNEDAYVYLFNLHTDGTVTRIFPNRFDSHNYLYANHTKYLPSYNSRYSFYVDGPTGYDKVIAVASKERLNTSTLANFRSEHDFFAQGTHNESSFARSLSIVVEPIDNYAWVTDYVHFYIRY